MKTVFLFTRNGMGDAPQNLQQTLAVKFLILAAQAEEKPAQIVFYAEGVKLVCEGSLVLEWLRILAAAGVELTICSTCLEYFELTEKVRVGKISGMPGIFAALQEAEKVISL